MIAWTLILPLTLVGIALLRIVLIPAWWGWNLLLHSACGLCCLWLLRFAGFVLPINLVTTVIAGALGIPGIALLTMVQSLL